jgi:hypothetical protein
MTRLVLFFMLAGLGFFSAAARGAEPPANVEPFPPPLESYRDGGASNLWAVLANRIHAEPFNLIATAIFLLAIIHTFLAPKILHLSHRLQRDHEKRLQEIDGSDTGLSCRRRQSIPAAMLHFVGEVEAVFGIWIVPLALALLFMKGPDVTRHYFNSGVKYTEPLFVVVIMAIAASRPIVQFTIYVLGLMAGNSPARWWLAILTVGPLFGSFITEPAAMTICALLLGREFYRLGPGKPFMYATLGLLFVNVSVGGALTDFAAPPVLMVAAKDKWDWSSAYMFEQVGIRALSGIVIGNVAYFLIFQREFARMTDNALHLPRDEAERREPAPLWITGVHFAFLGWTVLVAHEPALFIGGFLFFLAFTMATLAYQDEMNIRSPMLVGFFLAGLVVHGGLQAWWIEPVLSRLSRYPLLIGATVLTAFNDNAAITYLATFVPNFSDEMKDAVVSGALCGGGLTVIANAPNPAGQSILQKYFPEGSIAPGGLFLAALGPTLVMLLLFALPG